MTKGYLNDISMKRRILLKLVSTMTLIYIFEDVSKCWLNELIKKIWLNENRPEMKAFQMIVVSSS